MTSYSDLENLARIPTSESRCELAHRLTDMYLENMHLDTGAQDEVFSDIVIRVLREMDFEAWSGFRAESGQAGAFPAFDRQGIGGHGQCGAELGAESSPLLSEDDLLALARRGRGRAIARRPELTQRLTDALLEFGAHGIVRSLAGNPGAHFSSAGRSRMATLARDDDTLQSVLAERDDPEP